MIFLSYGLHLAGKMLSSIEHVEHKYGEVKSRLRYRWCFVSKTNQPNVMG